MAISADELAALLRAFNGRRQVVQAARRGLNRAVPGVRAAIREHAVATLPAAGGLGRWAAAARIGVKISYAARSAGIRLTGGRKSLTDKSDLTRLDAGRARAPSWGHRTKASWHTVAVTPGWFTEPAAADEGFRDHVDDEVDKILGVLRGA